MFNVRQVSSSNKSITWQQKLPLNPVGWYGGVYAGGANELEWILGVFPRYFNIFLQYNHKYTRYLTLIKFCKDTFIPCYKHNYSENYIKV